MANRVDDNDVIGLLAAGRDYNTVDNPSLRPFIRAANLLANAMRRLAVQSFRYAHSNEELKEIELWLAAHFYQMSDQGYQSRSTGGASGSFQGQRGKGLEATNYGQAALRLDVSGALEAIDKRKFAHVSWLGKDPVDQIEYQEGYGRGSTSDV